MFTHDEMAATDRLLTTTRAVRKRLDLDRPVAREVVLECLQLALHAPNAGNAQRWRWLLVDDPAVRAELGALYRRALEARMGARPSAYEGAMASSIHHLAAHMHEVPVLVVPCTTERYTSEIGLTGASSLFSSVIPAAWSLMLALRSRGLASSWTTVHLDFEREAAEVLGLPARVTQVGLIAVAHALGGDFAPAVRRDIGEVAFWNRWPDPGPTPPA